MKITELTNEEKVRLDPKCWKGKKIGNPKTKMKGDVRVNNCVPAESVEEASLATMRDYFAGDKNADDPSASSQQRNYFSKNDGSKSAVTKKFRSPAEYEQWLAQQKKDKQAFKVSEGVIIGASETGDPMDPQVAVLGGAGSYSLKGLYNKAQRESAQLTKDIGLGNFRSSSHNVKQLANTLNTIVAAHNELEAIRKGGGAKSRGIERGVDYKE